MKNLLGDLVFPQKPNIKPDLNYAVHSELYTGITRRLALTLYYQKSWLIQESLDKHPDYIIFTER